MLATERSSIPEKMELSTDHFLESIRSGKSKKIKPVLSSSSLDNSDDPSLEMSRKTQDAFSTKEQENKGFKSKFTQYR